VLLMQVFIAIFAFLLLLQQGVRSTVVPRDDGNCKHGLQLKADVEDLESDPLPFVVQLGKPHPSRQVLLNQKLREVVWNTTCGGEAVWPWKLRVDIAVAKGSYKKEHRIIFEVHGHYPNKAPVARFGSNIIHSHVAPLESMHTHVLRDRGFLDSVTGGNRLRSTLVALYDLLRKPPSKELEKEYWMSEASKFRKEAEVVRKYLPKRTHEELFTVAGLDMETWVVEPLRALISNISAAGSRDDALAHLLSSNIVTEVIPGMVYSFPVFSSSFCEILLDELRRFTETGLPARRPNSMNNYGIILNEIGMEPLMFAIQDKIIQPLAAVLFPKEGSELEGHHAFTVRYKGGEDTHLDVHTDDSDVTFNVNIHSDYKGCPLVFCGMMGEPDHRKFQIEYWHRLGHAVIHSGRHRHGAEDITNGERINLIIWSYSQNYRRSPAYKKAYQAEASEPDLRCLSYTHDRDYGTFKTYPVGKRSQFFGKGWCPKKGKEYRGFVDETTASRRQAAVGAGARKVPSTPSKRSSGEL